MTSTSLLDHILTNSSERVSQSGVPDVGLSDHQMTYCTRKITRLKHNTHKFVKARSFKTYSKDSYLQELENAKFPEYSESSQTLTVHILISLENSPLSLIRSYL